MDINQEDLRVVKTKRGLREAFIRLLMENEYDTISIQDIATEAQAARVTFYRHYKNKEELLVDCLKATYIGLEHRMEHINPDDFRLGFSPMQAFYEHVQEQEPLYQILFSSRGTQAVVDKVRRVLAERSKVLINQRFSAQEQLVPLDLIAYHFASAQIGLATWWLENGKPYPPEYMAQVSFWLSMAGTVRAIGLTLTQLVDPPPIPEV